MQQRVLHSFIPDISIAPLGSTTTQRHSQLQHCYCVGVETQMHSEATTSEGLAQGPYVATSFSYFWRMSVCVPGSLCTSGCSIHVYGHGYLRYFYLSK